MFRFEHPEYLYALLLVPALIVAAAWSLRRRGRTLRQLGEQAALQRMMPGWSETRQWARWGILWLALVLLIIGWANPQWGTKRQKMTRKAADIILALDISQSMLTEDIAPNRMEVAKRFGAQLLESLQGERIGLIVFAGSAYTQTPITTDYGALGLFLKSSSPEQAPYQGTAIGSAIELAGRLFPPEQANHKALVVLTDGETHDEDALDKAREAREQGMLIFTVGVGTETGGFVVEQINGQKVFKKDNSGEPVKSQVNVEMLQELAAAGGGQYFPLNNPRNVVEGIRKAVDQLDRKEMEERVYDEYESYFQYFIAAGLFLLLLEFFLPAMLQTKNAKALNHKNA
jgi:Ca-activated chloride channel family protein